MTDSDTKYYILFANYTHGMALHELLIATGIPNRIAPAPRSIQGKLSCGMSLLLKPENINAAKACIEEHKAEYDDIVPLSGQNKSSRDRYC